MKLIYALIIVCSLQIFTMNKVIANEKFGLVLMEYAQRHDKPTLIFFDQRWCSENAKTLHKTVQILDEYSRCYKIVVCTTAMEALDFYNGINVDTFIDIKAFFSKQLSTRKEWQTMAKLYDKFYSTSVSKFIFTPSYMHIIDKEKFVDAFLYDYAPTKLEQYKCK